MRKFLAPKQATSAPKTYMKTHHHFTRALSTRALKFSLVTEERPSTVARWATTICENHKSFSPLANFLKLPYFISP
jgi:hypothetical protein